MKRMFFINAIFLLIHDTVGGEPIESKIDKYFNSEVYQDFDRYWQKYKGAFENSIRLNIQQTFGHKKVNVFSYPYDVRTVIVEGLYFEDNVVSLLVRNLTLREMPFLRQPDVTFNLPDHELRVASGLSTIIIEAEYLLFRNRSNVIFTSDLDPQKQSPFSSSLVHTSGLLTIVANDCTLNGNTLSILSGTSITLLQDNFAVKNCRYYVEVYRPDSGNPPMIAPYFSLSQGALIERALSPTITSELMTTLQGAITATINTTSIFGSDLLSKMRSRQKYVFRETLSYLRKVVSTINLHTRDENQGSLALEPLHISWDDSEGERRMNKFSLQDMTVFGLDSIYSSAQGGPYKDELIRITDMMRFSTLQVRGKVMMSNNVTKDSEKDEFMLVMRDFAMRIRLNVDYGYMKSQRQQATKGVNIFEIIGWRKVEYSILNPGTGRFASHALAVAYLNEEVAKELVRQFFPVFEKAVQTAEDPENDPSILQLPASAEDDEQDENEEITPMNNQDTLKDKKLIVVNPNRHQPLNIQEAPLPEENDDENNLRTYQALKRIISVNNPIRKDLVNRLEGNPAKNFILDAADKVL